jgi:hypothetical protein
MAWKSLLFLLVLTTMGWTHAFYEKGSNVILIKDEKQFKKDVLESDFLWAVEFYREVGWIPNDRGKNRLSSSQ